MTETATKRSGDSEGDTGRQTGLLHQAGSLSRAIFASPAGKSLVILIVVLVLVVAATAYGQIRLNRWNKPFFDAMSRRDLRDFLFSSACSL